MEFGEMLAEVNGLPEKGFRRWLFADGMSFGDTGQWWGRQGKRLTPHEGVDFLFYETGPGLRKQLPAGALVPAAVDGEVVAVHGDFLGQTVWLGHGFGQEGSRRLYSVYGHLGSDLPVAIGAQVRAGSNIGTVADPTLAHKTIAAHLHLSVVLVNSVIDPCCLDWSTVQNPDQAELVDPLLLYTFL